MNIPAVLLLSALSAFAASGERYSVNLSETALEIRPDTGGAIRMQFPATPFDVSPDGRRVNYQNVFPGIDLSVYANSTGFEYDWVLAPGADPSNINVTFSGAESLRLALNGDLVLVTGGGEARHRRPFAYQDVNGHRSRIPAKFDFTADGRLRFVLGAYDKTQPLTIDPALSFASGIGGSGSQGYLGHGYLNGDFVSSMGLDSAGNIYIAGVAYSQDFPLVNPLPITRPSVCTGNCGCPAAFAAKLSPDAKTILYSTLLAYACSARPSLAVDSIGNVYVAGAVDTGYPFVQTGGGTSTGPVNGTGYLLKLDPNGALKASVPIGGSGGDAVTSIALGPDGKLYLTGTTRSKDFPVTASALRPALSSASDLFLMKLDPALLTGNQFAQNAILYSTYLGPGVSPVVAADAGGSAYVAGSTTSTAWITTPGAFQSECWDAARVSCADVIVMRVNPQGTQFQYATYLGGSGEDTIGGIALDGSGSLYLSGTTSSFDFPVTPHAYFTGQLGQSLIGFAAKLSSDGTHLIYGTLLDGGGNFGRDSAIAVDSTGNAWVGGVTHMNSFPVLAGVQQTLFNAVCEQYTPDGSSPTGAGYCSGSGYLVEVNPSGTAVLWRSYLGGGDVTQSFSRDSPAGPALTALVFDASGNLLVAGGQLSIVSDTAAPSHKNSASVVKIAPGGTSLSNLFVSSVAGFEPGLPAPGGLAALYFSTPSPPANAVAPGLPLPLQLAGVSITVNGVPAPIVSASALTNQPNTVQVNFQVPFESDAGHPRAHVVKVQYAGLAAFVVPQQSGPAIFTLADGSGVIQHASDYTLVTNANPVQRGENLIIYATGLGVVTSPVASGTGTTGADPVTACNEVRTNAGNVLYAGLTPGFPGLYQVNVQVSPYLAPGTVGIYLESQSCWADVPPANVYRGNSVNISVR